MRDKENQLKDIEFPFDVEHDTAELIAGELVEAQLVGPHDDAAVAGAIASLLQSAAAEIRFRVSGPVGIDDAPDEESLVGYALLMRC